MGKFYGPYVWDPILIISQIISMQCLFYVSLGLLLFIFGYFADINITLDEFFSDESFTTSTFLGWITMFSFIASSVVSALFLMVIVERARKCLDFAATLYIIHIFICIIYDGFPTSGFWWFLNFVGFLVMAVLGEYLCFRREMQDIHFSSVHSSSMIV